MWPWLTEQGVMGIHMSSSCPLLYYHSFLPMLNHHHVQLNIRYPFRDPGTQGTHKKGQV